MQTLSLESDHFELSLNINFVDISEFFNSLRDAYFLFKQKGNQYEENLDEVIFKHYNYTKQINVQGFNKTRVKTLTEKRMIPKECKVKYVLPLVSIDALVYLTDQRIYMQPLHAQILEKPVINLKVGSIKELFKRRYTLMDIGLEIISVSKADTRSPKRKTMYLVFKTTKERNVVYESLLKMVGKECITTERNLDEYTNLWV